MQGCRERPRELARCGKRAAVDGGERGEEAQAAGEEDLVGLDQHRGLERGLARCDAEARGQLEHQSAGDAGERTLRERMA